MYVTRCSVVCLSVCAQVTKDTWDAIVRFYPGSGPEITMDFAPPKGGVKDGYVDTASWQVLQHDPPPEQDGGGSRKKKSQARKRFEAFRLNLMASKQRAAEEKAGQGVIPLLGWVVVTSSRLYCVCMYVQLRSPRRRRARRRSRRDSAPWALQPHP